LIVQITIISSSKANGSERAKVILLGDKISHELYEQIHFLQYHYPAPIVFLHTARSYWEIFDE